MKAAVVHSFGQPLRIEDVPKPVPGPGECVVKIEASGLCHTDIHAAKGHWPLKPNLPLIPGHEGVGIVESVGAGVKEVKEGDRVGVPWIGAACGGCNYCVGGWETLCHSYSATGYFVAGGYAEYALANAKYVGKVPPRMDPFAAAPLTCAGVTTYKAVKISGARPNSLTAIFGIGGLGHMAVQYAKLFGSTVVAVDLVDEKLQMAKELGADFTINARTQDVVEEMRKLGKANQAVVVAVSPRAYVQAYQSLARRGKLVFVGLPEDNCVQIPIFETVLDGIQMEGSVVGNRQDLADVYDIHAAGKTKVIYEKRPLETVNKSFEDVEAGRAKARIVLTI